MLMSELQGELRKDEPMSRHTSWRAGGVANWFYSPRGKGDLGRFLKRLPREAEVTWCGLGSNMLVRDGGYPGVVICTHKGLNQLKTSGDNGVYAEAGVTCAKLAKYAVKNRLGGIEFMVGIPGTVGGALAMNAGCFGSETWEVVRYAKTIDRNGRESTKMQAAVRWGYRSVARGDDEWFTGAEFSLRPCIGTDNGLLKIKQLLKKRAATQPIQTANAGSVFRNPKGDHAARLLETAGLKGFVLGGARFSPVHANFIENQSGASAWDIENLIDYAVEQVERIHGIKLELEVRIIGEKV